MTNAITNLLQAAGFASRLLGKLAGPELEQRLVELLLAELSRLPDERIAALRNCCGGKAETMVVTSAWPLPEAQREQLQQALTAVMGSSLPLTFQQDTALLAGVRITIGARVLSANLQDELKSLADFAHDAQ